MMWKYRHRRFHEFAKTFGAIAGRQVSCDLLIGDVVRRGGCHFLFAVPPHHQVAIANTREELDVFRSQFSSDVMDDRSSLFCRYMPGGEILHKRIVSISSQSHQITAESDILGCK